MSSNEAPTNALDLVEHSVGHSLLNREARPLILGICGAQGSGKSTLADGLAARLNARDISAACLSIDDLYLTKAARSQLAQDVHPLLRTRGVPGTHDVALGMAVLDDLHAGQPARLPRFDKACDDRLPKDQWTAIPAGLQVLLFEGWCVGARAQPEAALAEPVNTLERDEDKDARWRTYVNQALANDYQPLFDRIDSLVLLAAPGFEIVQRWRGQQEDSLRRRSPPGASGVMTKAQIARFIQHYERLTRYILVEMPKRADITLSLATDRSVTQVVRQTI